MTHWVVAIPPERLDAQRLYHHETVALDGIDPGAAAPGDEVLLVATTTPPVLFGTGRVVSTDPPLIAYRQRSIDDPRPIADLALSGALTPITPQQYAESAALLPVPADRREWLVSVDLPIEAESAAEAVRLFWAYVRELGPTELPALVAPLGDELAMQAFVLGEPTELDPEEA